MIHARRLLTASLLGGLVTVAAGCGSDHSSAAQSDGGQALVGSSAVQGTTAAAVANAAEEAGSSATVSAADGSAASHSGLDNSAPAAAIDQVSGTTEGDVTVARPAAVGTDLPSGSASPANATDPAGGLIAAVGTTDVTAAAAAPAGGPRVPKLLIPEKSFRHEKDALRVSYDDLDLLKVLNMEPVAPNAPDLFPQWLKDLEGKRIRIRGYMRPGELSENIPFFVLARDTNACCFGPNTKAYDIIPVIMRDGVTTDYIHMQPFDIVGVFHTGVEMDFANPEKVEFLYRIEDAVLIRKSDSR